MSTHHVSAATKGHGSNEKHGSHGKRALSNVEQQQKQRSSKRQHYLDSPRTRSPSFAQGGVDSMVHNSDVVVATAPCTPSAGTLGHASLSSSSAAAALFLPKPPPHTNGPSNDIRATPVAETTKAALPRQHQHAPYNNNATDVCAEIQRRSDAALVYPLVGGSSSSSTKRRLDADQSSETSLMDGVDSDSAKNDSGKRQVHVREPPRDYADWCSTLPPNHELFHGQASLPLTSPEQLSTAESVAISTCAAASGIVNPYAKRKCRTLRMESSAKESSSDCSIVFGEENKLESCLDDDDGGGKSGVKGRMPVYEPIPPLDSIAVAASRLAVRPAVEQAKAVNSLMSTPEPRNADDFPPCLVHFPLGRLRTSPEVSLSWLGDGVIGVNESLGRHYYIGFKLKGVEFFKGDVVRLGIENEKFPFGQTYRRHFIIVSAFQATKSFLGRYGKTVEAEIQHRGMKALYGLSCFQLSSIHYN
jgi:hypothetical protein